ncbi:sulfatase-like hydrolase/transferase [Ruficoccus amylovorans]|uniref:Sulfatase-like hydrolase/transferase n=1 Tax=Ruficoccus amylovorans TaxID=1804625 RepID=A0A842HI76_9BACT|nr:sulfatase-like hydrolase/transferase [Ruficoccus amylovorans]MBC2595227.1 sulfatase-like hydrolase/transferase [Ruficoccus amylovorans]
MLGKTIFYAAAMSVGVIGQAADQVPGGHPNIIVIVADDLGHGDLSLTGSEEIKTPNIDSLAANGSFFTDAYISAPVCLPSRMGLMTGTYQERFGVQTLAGPGGTRDYGIPADRPTLAQELKADGYTTGAVGKWHLGEREEYLPNQKGFDDFYGFIGGSLPYFPDKPGMIWHNERNVEKTQYMTDDFGERAAAFIEENRGDPFFLYLAFSAVHLPLEATEKYIEPYNHIKDRSRRTYAAMTTAMDINIGLVLDALRKNGLYENTLVFFVSDNGGFPRFWASNAPFQGGKYVLYEGGIRTPFLVQWPAGGVPAARRFSEPVSALDIFPTALAAAGAEYSGPHALDGVNLLPLLRGQTDKAPHERLYWRYGPYMCAMREGDFKILKNGTGDNKTPQWALYDIVNDPGETMDLSTRMPDKFSAMKNAFTVWDEALPEPDFIDQRLVEGIAWWEVKKKGHEPVQEQD